MNKKQKTSKKKDLSRTGELCFYMGMGGYGYSDRGLVHFGHFDHCGYYHDVCCC